MPFQTAKVILTGEPGAWKVERASVRRQGTEAFSMVGSPPSSSVPPPVGVPPQPFTLDPAQSTEDPNDSRFQIAELVFIGNIDAWLPFFDLGRKLSQTMFVEDGVGPIELPIEMSRAALAAEVKKAI